MADISLRKKQDIWEHPRNIAILIGATAALVGAGAGFLRIKVDKPPHQSRTQSSTCRHKLR